MAMLAILMALQSPPVPPKTPNEAVAIADARIGHATPGTYRMTVAAAGHLGPTLFLNSMSDYRAKDDLTFELNGHVVKALRRRLGGDPETLLVGRTITVKGKVEAVPVVTRHGGRTYFARYQHQVRVGKASDLVVEPS